MSHVNNGLSKDEVLELLSNARRRYVLYYLSRRDDGVDLSDLAANIAAWEADRSVESITDEDRRRVYISLYQTHLPKLEQAGIVSYDTEERTVRLNERATRIVEYLIPERSRRSWYPYYALLSGAALIAMLGLILLDIPLFAAAVGSILALLVLSLTVLQYVYERRGEGPDHFEWLID